MTVKERILALRLLERLEKDSGMVEIMGLQIRMVSGSDSEV